MQQQEKLT